MDIKDIYLENKEKNVWNLRFMWKTPKGTVIHSSSISDFFKSFDVNTVFSGITDVLTFYNKVIGLVDNYLKFIVDNGRTVGDHMSYTDKELKDARNFFVGAIGEYFFLETLLNKGKIEFRTFDKKGVVGKVFYNATLAPNVDYGIDGVCQDEYGKNCVIQVKFWNPWDKNIKVDHELVQSFVGRGLLEGITERETKKDSIFCWIGNDQSVSRWIHKDELLNNKLLFIDRNVINNSIPNGQNSMFWKDTFLESMKDISQIR